MDWSDSTTQRTFRNEVVNYINENLPTYYKNSKPPTGLEAGDCRIFLYWVMMSKKNLLKHG